MQQDSAGQLPLIYYSNLVLRPIACPFVAWYSFDFTCLSFYRFFPGFRKQASFECATDGSVHLAASGTHWVQDCTSSGKSRASQVSPIP
jgi:hypothetical protein